MTREEAINKVRQMSLPKETMEILQALAPELAESEDEKVLQALISGFENWKDNDIVAFYDTKVDDIIAYLEKQKEQNGKDEECTDFTIYHPLKNGKGEYKCLPYSFYGSLTSFSEDKGLINFLRTCFYTEEECNEWIEQQKKQKPEFYPGDVVKCTSTGSLWVRCKAGDNRRSDGHTACFGGEYKLASKEEAVQFFQELTKNGYQWDCIKGKPIKKEQKSADKDAVEPAPKQDYSKLNGLERAIHRGFLCAGVENVPVEIIKETAQDCITHIDHKPVEWSGTNDLVFKDICEHLEEEEYGEWVVLLKALRDGKFQVKQDWSAEDEKKYQCIRNILLTDTDKKVGSWKYSEILEWYEKRGVGRYTNSKPSWKPSEE